MACIDMAEAKNKVNEYLIKENIKITDEYKQYLVNTMIIKLDKKSQDDATAMYVDAKEISDNQGNSSSTDPVDIQRITESTSDSLESSSDIKDITKDKLHYSLLENKTKTGNVVIVSDKYGKNGQQYAKDNGMIFSMRVKGQAKHFGNPFSSDSRLVTRDNLTKTKDTKESVEKYIDWIKHSNDDRAKWIRSVLDSGNLKGKKILYYKELGEPSYANALDMLINNWKVDKLLGKKEHNNVVTDEYDPVSFVNRYLIDAPEFRGLAINKNDIKDEHKDDRKGINVFKKLAQKRENSSDYDKALATYNDILQRIQEEYKAVSNTDVSKRADSIVKIMNNSSSKEYNNMKKSVLIAMSYLKENPDIEIHEPEFNPNKLFASNDLTDEEKIALSENEASSKLDIAKLNIINKYWIKKLGIKVTEGDNSEYVIGTGNIIINKNLNKKDKVFLLAHEIKHAITYNTILEQEGSENTKIVLDELDNIIMNNYDKFNEHTLDRLNYARGQDTETKKMAEIVAILSSEKSVRNDVLKTVYKDKKSVQLIQRIIKAFKKLFNISTKDEEFNIINSIDAIVKSSKLKVKPIKEQSYSTNFDKSVQEPATSTGSNKNVQGSVEDVNDLYRPDIGDTIETYDIDLGENENFLGLMEKMIKEDRNVDVEGGVPIETTSVEFYDMQNEVVLKMQDALSHMTNSKITLSEIKTSVDEFYESQNATRETAGSIEHTVDENGYGANVRVRWNQLSGSAGKTEVFMHEIVHFLTSRAFQESPALASIIEQMRQEAIKNGVDHTIFLQDLANAGLEPLAEDIEVAHLKFQYIFDENSDPEEFFAYAVTNQHVFEAIKDITITPVFIDKISTVDELSSSKMKKFKDLINKFIELINKIYVAISQTPNKGSDLIVDTMMKMVDLQSEMDIKNAALDAESQSKLDKFVNGADQKLAPIIAKMDLAINSLEKSSKESGKMKSFTKKLENTIVIGRILQGRFFQDIFDSITKKTDNPQWAHLYQMFRQGKEFTENHSKDIADAVKRNVGDMFSDTDKSTRKAITGVVFKLDLPSLEDDNIDMDNIKNLLIDDEFLSRAYVASLNEVREAYMDANRTIKSPFKSKKQEFESDLRQALALGKHMNDENIHIANQQFNAENIFHKFYLSGTSEINTNEKVTVLDKALIKKLNKLITLSALQEAPQVDKTLVHDYLSTKKHRDNITYMMNMYQSYVNDSVDKMNITNFNSIKKGFFESRNGNNVKFEIIPEYDLPYYIGFMGGMHQIDDNYFATIDGIKHYKLAGRSHELGYEEGMFSIAGQGVSGISLKSVLTANLTAKNQKLRESDRVSRLKMDESVAGMIDKMINGGGQDESVYKPESNTYLVPVYDTAGEIVDYNIQLNKLEKSMHMKLDSDVAEAASYTFMKLKHRQAAIAQNMKAVDTLMEYSADNVMDNPEDFITLEKHEKGPFIENIHGRWNRIPDYTRNYIYHKTGQNKLVIPKNMAHLITGDQEVSVSNANIGRLDLRKSKKTQKLILAIEDYVREILAYAKQSIAIRMGGVVMANTISNMMQTWINTGINPIEYIRRSRIKWQQLNKYTDIQRKIDDMEVEYNAANENKKKNIERRIALMKAQLEKNPFDILVKDGQFSPIVDDINVDEENKGHIANLIEKGMKSNSFVKAVNPIKEFMFMDQNTALYKTMMKITQYGDVITREIIREHKVSEAIAKGKPLTTEENQRMLNWLDQLFVNYSYTDNKYLKWFERVGGVFFTKYLFRQAKAMHSVLLMHPGRLGTQIGLETISGIDIKTADDDYFRFLDTAFGKFATNPYDVGIETLTPNIFRWLPDMGDIYT